MLTPDPHVFSSPLLLVITHRCWDVWGQPGNLSTKPRMPHLSSCFLSSCNCKFKLGGKLSKEKQKHNPTSVFFFASFLVFCSFYQLQREVCQNPLRDFGSLLDLPCELNILSFKSNLLYFSVMLYAWKFLLSEINTATSVLSSFGFTRYSLFHLWLSALGYSYDLDMSFMKQSVVGVCVHARRHSFFS